METRLTALLVEILESHPEGLGEHRLMRLLGEAGLEPFVELDFHDPLALFQAHFLLFHVLYRLRDHFHEQRRAQLQIHTLAIRLGPYLPGEEGLARDDPLRRYYLDLENLERVDREAVEVLLDRFWRRLADRGDTELRRRALAELGLSEPVSLEEIRRRYRKLAARHHPDRGGDATRMQRLNAAWRVLNSGSGGGG